MTLAARLAARENVATFLAFAKRLPAGAGYSLHVKRLDPAYSVNRAIEELVRECPEQYLWGYNRYKIPSGVAPPPPAS